MKLIIAGSRDIKPNNAFLNFLIVTHFDIEPTLVINGDAKGVDRAGYRWAKKRKISTMTMEANWQKYGRGAGAIRNEEMAKEADALLLIWDGKSDGSRNMRMLADQYKLEVYELRMRCYDRAARFAQRCKKGI